MNRKADEVSLVIPWPLSNEVQLMNFSRVRALPLSERWLACGRQRTSFAFCISNAKALHNGRVAQLLMKPTSDRKVRGSNPGSLGSVIRVRHVSGCSILLRKTKNPPCKAINCSFEGQKPHGRPRADMEPGIKVSIKGEIIEVGEMRVHWSEDQGGLWDV